MITARADKLLLPLSSCIIVHRATAGDTNSSDVLHISVIPPPPPHAGSNKSASMPRKQPFSSSSGTRADSWNLLAPPVPVSSPVRGRRPLSPSQSLASPTLASFQRPRLYARTRAPRQKDAPMSFDEMEEEMATGDGSSRQLSNSGTNPSSQLPVVRRKFGIFSSMTMGGVRIRERGAGHGRRRSVRGI